MRHGHDMHPDGGGSVGCARVARGSLAPPGGSPAESSVGSGVPVRGIFLRRNLGFGKRQTVDGARRSFCPFIQMV